ncbi:hypothetical protein INR49_014633 [Caranx melampygus]|nr:hypothetical protein INR49_014633 [Caranx melampygus]
MCCVVKQAALLLLLLAVANYSPLQAADDCEGVNTPLPAKDLHKIFGDWVMVWAVADHQEGWYVLPHDISSRVEFRLLPDNTIMYNELIQYNGTNCSNYILNMSMPSDPTSDEHHPLVTIAATEQENNGVVKPYNDSAVMYMYVSCPDCLTVVYKNVQGRFLLFFRREGHHSDVEQLKAAHEGYRKKAECLNIPHHKPFIYDGLAGFCQMKPSPEIFGDWVLVWAVADHQQGWALLPHVTSSRVEFQLLPDNNTIMFSELNLYLGKTCSNYILNMSMPSDPTSDEHHPLVTIAATAQEEDGVVKPYNDSGVMYMYVSCPDCLTVVYRNILGRHLLIYRREGHHSDVEQLKAAHDGYRKKAECLNIPHDKPFIYDGLAGFCQMKPSPEVKQEES